MAVRELDSPPSLAALYPKALAGSLVLPLLRRVPVIGPGRPARELPATELSVSGVTLERERLNAYAKLCGYGLRDLLPPTAPHLIAFPLSVALMTDTSFPFGVLGLVHIRNRITQQRPLGVDEPLTVRVRTTGLADHDRGTQFDVVAEAAAGDGGETVWSSTSTYLRREGDGGKDREPRSGRKAPPQPSARWTVPGDIGRRYAGVSGDRNPIHLHPLTARLFGLPRPIAHGMWVKARCLAALETSLPPAFKVDVHFKAPMFIPAEVAFATRALKASRRFSVHDARTGTAHVEGTVTGLG